MASRKPTTQYPCSKETEIALLKQQFESLVNSMNTRFDNQDKKINEIHVSIVGNGKPGLKERMDKAEGGMTAIKTVYGLLIAGLGLVIAFIKM